MILASALNYKFTPNLLQLYDKKQHYIKRSFSLLA